MQLIAPLLPQPLPVKQTHRTPLHICKSIMRAAAHFLERCWRDGRLRACSGRFLRMWLAMSSQVSDGLPASTPFSVSLLVSLHRSGLM